MSLRLPASWRLWVCLALLAANALAVWAASGLYTTEVPVPPAAVRLYAGSAYVVELPLGSALLAPIIDSGTNPRRSPTVLLEDGVPLPLAHASPPAIAEQGAGRFRHGRDALMFSTSDNSDPSRNGRRYVARVTIALRPRLAVAGLLVSLLVLTGSFHRWTLAPLLRLLRAAYARLPMLRWIVANVLPGLAVYAGVMVACALAGEAYFRTRVPFIQVHWDWVADPRLGSISRPHTVAQFTNGSDFWQITPVNSQGFLSEEPPGEKPPGTCRVAFIGDSMVEAAQVPIAEKVHIRFRELARERLPGAHIDTVAYGASGTGQANQLPYYDYLARPLRPDVVVLPIVENDFTDNSNLLAGVQNGWHPDYPPRTFFRRGDDGRFVPVPISLRWQERALPTLPAPGGALPAADRFLRAHSYLYTWLIALAETQVPGLVNPLLHPGATDADRFRHRMEAIAALPGHAHAFDGWRYPDDLDLWEMFFAEPMPPVFNDALGATGAALDAWMARARRDGFRLLGLATSRLSRTYPPDTVRYGRHLRSGLYLRRFATLLEARGIPLIDQSAYIRAHGGSELQARFQHDGHWSPQGHIWAAEAVLDYFAAHPELCPHSAAR